MKKNNKKNKHIDTSTIGNIEKWILNDYSYEHCQHRIIKNIISDIKIHKERNMQLTELTLTSKMIIKIQTEIAKKYILDMLNV